MQFCCDYKTDLSVLIKKIGLESCTGTLPSDLNTNLAELNDDGYTFDEIADVIEMEYIRGVMK